jgi:hypothetical protein
MPVIGRIFEDLVDGRFKEGNGHQDCGRCIRPVLNVDRSLASDCDLTLPA